MELDSITLEPDIIAWLRDENIRLLQDLKKLEEHCKEIRFELARARGIRIK